MDCSVEEGGSSVSSLLAKLCCSFAQNDKEKGVAMYKMALKFLVKPCKNVIKDEQAIIANIRSSLSSPQIIQRFDLLYVRLQRTSILQNRAAVLQFLHSLGLESRGDDAKSFVLMQELCHLPLPLSFGSKDSQSSSSVPEDEKTEVRKLYSSTKLSRMCSSTQFAENAVARIPSTTSTKSDYTYQTGTFGPSLSLMSEVFQSVPERILMDEVVYSLQGIEGRILKREPGGLGFMVDSKVAKSLDALQRSLLERLMTIGFLHNQLKQHCDDIDKQIGIIAQSLVATLQDEFSEYYKSVAIVRSQLSCELSLRKMLIMVAEPSIRLQWLCYIAEQCTDKKGGAIISAVHGFLQHGAVFVQKIASKVLLAVCRPLYILLSRWLLDGELNDPSGEFFITARSITSAERLWHDKYHVKTSMVPSFITMDQAKKILATGKSINFLRQICKDSNQLPGREALQKIFDTTTAESLYEPDKCIDLHLKLENVYRETSQRVLIMLKDSFHLLDHLQALRRYLLLGQGDFIRHLLELLTPELSKPAKNVYGHTLTTILESAVRVTNAQFEDEDVLKRLTISLLHQCTGDTGWDIFSLAYIVDGPVGTILRPALTEYQSLFGSLWKAKRMEYVLSNMRKQQISSTKMFSGMKELLPTMHLIHMLSSEMIHFLNQTQYYFLFEVLECSWAEMMRQVNQAECLDDVITAHNAFLNSVQCGVLLDSGCDSEKGSTEMVSKLRVIYNLILHLETVQESLCALALQEYNFINKMQQQVQFSEKLGKHGLTRREEMEARERKAKFNGNLLLSKRQVKQISRSYRQFVQEYLTLLAASQDLNLQLLCERLNFNSFYKIM